MSIDDIYITLSARITQEVVNHQTLDWTRRARAARPWTISPSCARRYGA